MRCLIFLRSPADGIASQQYAACRQTEKRDNYAYGPAHVPHTSGSEDDSNKRRSRRIAYASLLSILI